MSPNGLSALIGMQSDANVGSFRSSIQQTDTNDVLDISYLVFFSGTLFTRVFAPEWKPEQFWPVLISGLRARVAQSCRGLAKVRRRGVEIPLGKVQL